MRVTVSMVLGQLAAGQTIEQVLADYRYLERADVLAALEYAAAIAQEPEVLRTASGPAAPILLHGALDQVRSNVRTLTGRCVPSLTRATEANLSETPTSISSWERNDEARATRYPP
jgi:hypothetical protein